MHGRSDMARMINGGLFSGPKRSLRALGNQGRGASRLWSERRHRDTGLFYGWYLLHACESLERLHGRLVWIEDGARPWT